MPITEVSVCNSALAKLGENGISSLTEDTRSASIINGIFEQIRDEVMSSHPWTFALKRAALIPTANTPVYDYDYEYDLPSDYLSMVDTEYDYSDEEVDYSVEGNKLLSNYATMNIRYVYRIEDPTYWSPMFAEAFAWRLAENLALPITNSSEKVLAMQQGYERAISQARFNNGIQSIAKILIKEDWANSRR